MNQYGQLALEKQPLLIKLKKYMTRLENGLKRMFLLKHQTIQEFFMAVASQKKMQQNSFQREMLMVFWLEARL